MRRNPTVLTVMLMLTSIPAIVECEVASHRSIASFADQMNQSFRMRGLNARAEIRGDFIVVREM